MIKFKTYLINKGIHFETAHRYMRVAEQFVEWLNTNNLKAGKIKRSNFTQWLQECREQGNCERTISQKETIIRTYYYYLGYKTNPALSWIKKTKEHTLPPSPISEEELIKIYHELKPRTPSEHRNRCLLGLVLFQALKRSELKEIRISDVCFEKGEIYVVGQRKTNSRRLKLESFQVLHLYEYYTKYRKDFLVYKKNNPDNFFLSKGSGARMDNSIAKFLYQLRIQYPHINNLLHIRGSVITNWQKKEGVMEAMVKAGHRYISSTQRYQTNNYDELQEKLKNQHPLEQQIKTN